MQVLRNSDVNEINAVLRKAICSVASSIARSNYPAAHVGIDNIAWLYSDILIQGHLDLEGFQPGMIRPSQVCEIMEDMLKSSGNRFAMTHKNYRKTKCSMEPAIVARLRRSDIVCSVVPMGAGADFMMVFSSFVRRTEGAALRNVYTTTFDRLFSFDVRGAFRQVVSMLSGGAGYRRKAYEEAAPRIARVALKAVPDFIEAEGYALARADRRLANYLRRMLDAGLTDGSVERVALAEEQLVRLRPPAAVPQYA